MNNKIDDETTNEKDESLEKNDQLTEVVDVEEEKTKKEKDNKTKEEIEDLCNEVNKLIDEVSNKYDVDPSSIKVMPVASPKMPPYILLITCLFGLVITFVLFVGLSGLIPWAEWVKVPYMIYFALFFATSEQILKVCSLPLIPKNPKNIYLIMLIKAIPFILTMIICGIFPMFVKVTSIYLYVLLCALVYSIRKFFISFLLEKEMKKLMNNTFNNKKKRVK